MIRKILVPIKGNILDESIIRYVANSFPNAEYHIVTDIDTYQSGIQLTDLLYDEMKAGADEVLEFAKNILIEENIKNPITSVLEGIPYKRILSYANQSHIDLIVIGRYKDKRGIFTPRLSHTLKEVILHSQVPILMVPSECKCAKINNVLLFTDGTRRSKLAENFALLFSSQYQTDLSMMFIRTKENRNVDVNETIKNLKWKATHLGLKIQRTDLIGDSIEKMKSVAKKYNILIMGVGKKILFWSILREDANIMATSSSTPVIFVRALQKRWRKRI